MDEPHDVLYVKATDLNRGKASSWLKNVHQTNNEAIVLKNSEPYAVIMSYERYKKVMAMINNDELSKNE